MSTVHLFTHALGPAGHVFFRATFFLFIYLFVIMSLVYLIHLMDSIFAESNIEVFKQFNRTVIFYFQTFIMLYYNVNDLLNSFI